MLQRIVLLMRLLCIVGLSYSCDDRSAALPMFYYEIDKTYKVVAQQQTYALQHHEFYGGGIIKYKLHSNDLCLATAAYAINEKEQNKRFRIKSLSIDSSQNHNQGIWKAGLLTTLLHCAAQEGINHIVVNAYGDEECAFYTQFGFEIRRAAQYTDECTKLSLTSTQAYKTCSMGAILTMCANVCSVTKK